VANTEDPEPTVLLARVTTEVTALGAPGLTVTVVKEVLIKTPPTVALILVAVPATAPVNIEE
jgi:hypothetical protein